MNKADDIGETALIKGTKPEYQASDWHNLDTYSTLAISLHDMPKPSEKYEECVDILIEAGADVNFHDSDKSTAMIYSCKLRSKRRVYIH